MLQPIAHQILLLVSHGAVTCTDTKLMIENQTRTDCEQADSAHVHLRRDHCQGAIAQPYEKRD